MSATATATANRCKLVLTINGDVYTVRPLELAELPFGAVRAFRLIRRDAKSGKVTHVINEAIDGLHCSCEDQQFRQTPKGSACKHLSAARACGLF